MDLWSTLQRAVETHPAQRAIAAGEASVTYAQLGRRVCSLAAFLRNQGAAPGERIAILEVNSPAFLEAYYAAAGLGAILVPLNVRLAPPELAEILAHCGARWLIANACFDELVDATLRDTHSIEAIVWIGEPRHGIDRARRASYAAALAHTGAFEPARVGEDDVAQLYYTSGTTGRPKGVMLTHRNVALHALGTIAELGLSDADTWAHVAPMFHLADAWATFAITWVGGAHAFAPRFDEDSVLDLFERERVTLTNLVPTMLQRLVSRTGAAARDFSSLRMLLSGGAPIAPAVVRRVIETFRCEYVQTYGMTETSPYLTLSLLKQHLRALPEEEQFRYRAKTGRAFLLVELEVVGDNGRAVPRDGKSVGEIRARGPTVTPGYWRDPESTAAAFEDGWLCTGDLATIDAEGYLEIVDRKKDMIITGGEKVYSTEVEHALYAHAAVLEAAVFGVADDAWGERVAAAVALRPGRLATEAELIAHCRERLAAYKAPGSIRFVLELPKTGSGKIRKGELRK